MTQPDKERIEKEIAQILKENITFSPQLGDYVIHGAIEKIQELIEHKSVEDWNAAIDACKNLFEGPTRIKTKEWWPWSIVKELEALKK